ncbi:MAG: hypothetical protein ACREBJ_10870, partial [Nitrosotalea sp.]
MVQRAELSVAHSRHAESKASSPQPHRNKSGWLKVAIFAPLIIVGIGFLMYAITQNPNPPPHKPPDVDPNKQDPEFGPEYDICGTFKRTWDAIKYSTVECQGLRNIPSGFICLESIQPLPLHCNMTAEVEAQINDNKQMAKPMPSTDRLESEENVYVHIELFDALTGCLRNPNCESTNCSDLDQAQVRSREYEAITAINGYRFFTPSFEENQEILRLNKNDPREKTLFLSTPHTRTGGSLAPKEHTELL